MPSKKFKLNIATMPQWNILFEDVTQQDINDEILFFFYKNTLTPKEQKAFRILLKAQKQALLNSQEKLDSNIITARKISEKMDYLVKDERLVNLFSLRISDAIVKGLINGSSDVDEVFHKLMGEDMDLDKHEELIKEYEIIKKDGDVTHIYSVLDSEDTMYIYNSIWTEEETTIANLKLDEYVNGGLISNIGSYENELQLIMIIIRLESIILDYYDYPEDDDDEL